MTKAESTPTLRIEGLRLRTEQKTLVTAELVTGPGSVACAGEAKALVHAFIEPGLVERGLLLCRAEPPRQLLARLGAGYVPRRLAADPSSSVATTLLRSARLAGLGVEDVDQALDQVRSRGLQKERLDRLTPFQERLVGLAHGLCGQPALLILEDPYVGLDDDSAAAIEELLDEQFSTKEFITTIEADSPWSRRLLGRAAEVVVAAGDTLVGPFAPGALPSRGLWLICNEAAPGLVEALVRAQGQVTETPRPGVLFVRGLGGLEVLDIASECGVQVRELSPASP